MTSGGSFSIPKALFHRTTQRSSFQCPHYFCFLLYWHSKYLYLNR